MMKWRSQHGSTSMAEYALTIFLVIGTVVAITTYVKRSLQARMHDARHYMITEVSKDCDCNCKQTSGLINSIINNISK